LILNPWRIGSGAVKAVKSEVTDKNDEKKIKILGSGLIAGRQQRCGRVKLEYS